MLARRAEALLMDHGPPHSSWDALSHTSGILGRRRGSGGISDTLRLEHIATLSSSFAELRVYNPRLLEVIQCSLAPTVVAATQQLSDTAASSSATRRGTNMLLSERALGKFCWSIGRLGPPLPELHASLGTLSCAALPTVLDMETLAKVSWWSAVMQGLDASGPVKLNLEQVGRDAAEHPVPAAVARRLAELMYSNRGHVRQGVEHSDQHAMFASSVLWGLACHEWKGGDFVNTFWAVLGPPAATNIRRRSIGMRCRLHQCLIEIQSNSPDSPSHVGWQAEMAAQCHQAFLKSARQNTQSSTPGDTMQHRVGQMLRRATESAVEHEVVLPSGYTVDFLVRTGSDSQTVQHPAGRLIAVEVLPFILLSSIVPRAPGALLECLV